MNTAINPTAPSRLFRSQKFSKMKHVILIFIDIGSLCSCLEKKYFTSDQ